LRREAGNAGIFAEVSGKPEEGCVLRAMIGWPLDRQNPFRVPIYFDGVSRSCENPGLEDTIPLGLESAVRLPFLRNKIAQIEAIPMVSRRERHLVAKGISSRKVSRRERYLVAK